NFASVLDAMVMCNLYKTAVVLLLSLGPVVPGGELLSQGNKGSPPVSGKQTPAEKQTPRLDLQGAPLPDGALARLGTMRMRHGQQSWGAVFSKDGKYIFASDLNDGVRVWDVADGKEVRHFFKNQACGPLALAPDGRTLAVALGYGPECGTVRLCDPI